MFAISDSSDPQDKLVSRNRIKNSLFIVLPEKFVPHLVIFSFRYLHRFLIWRSWEISFNYKLEHVLYFDHLPVPMGFAGSLLDHHQSVMVTS